MHIDISGAAIHQLLSSIAKGNSEVRELLSSRKDFQPGHCQEVWQMTTGMLNMHTWKKFFDFD